MKGGELRLQQSNIIFSNNNNNNENMNVLLYETQQLPPFITKSYYRMIYIMAFNMIGSYWERFTNLSPF